MDNVIKSLAIRFDFSHQHITSERLIFFPGFTDCELKHFRAYTFFFFIYSFVIL